MNSDNHYSFSVLSFHNTLYLHVGIPAALRQSGFLTGTVLLILVAIITDYTVILLIKDAFLANKFSYQEMVTAAFGRPGYWYLTFAQFFFPFFGKSLTHSNIFMECNHASIMYWASKKATVIAYVRDGADTPM